MKPKSLSNEQIKKLAIAVIGMVALLYVYFTFLLGPLQTTRASMLVKTEDLQRKIASSKPEMAKSANLEKQAGTATTRFAALKALTPEGAPIAWFPPRIKTFFSRLGVEKATARLENNGAFSEPELSAWVKSNWLIDLPQTDYASAATAIAELENNEPLLAVKRISIKSSPETPQFQQVALAVTTALVKR